MARKLGAQLVATFIAAAVPNITIGQVFDVAAIHAALMSGGVAVLGVVQALAIAYRDGELTADEISDAFGDTK